MLTLALTLLKNSWKQIIIGLAIFGVVYIGYNWIYDRGYADSSAAWTKIVEKQAKDRDDKIQELTGYARSNLEQSLINNQKVLDDLMIIKRNAKGKPTTVIINGDCKPSSEFIDSYNKAIEKGNTK